MIHSLIDILRFGFLREAHIFAQRLFYQLTGTGHDEFVCQVEEFGLQFGNKRANGTICILAPFSIFSVAVCKEVAKRLYTKVISIESVILATSYQIKLTFHIAKPCVDGRSREHEHFQLVTLFLRLNLDEFFHQFLIAARLLITQVVAFVDNYQQLFALLQVVQTECLVGRLQAFILKVCMEAHLIVELIFVEA